MSAASRDCVWAVDSVLGSSGSGLGFPLFEDLRFPSTYGGARGGAAPVECRSAAIRLVVLAPLVWGRR